jgi:hypothetical protein
MNSFESRFVLRLDLDIWFRERKIRICQYRLADLHLVNAAIFFDVIYVFLFEIIINENIIYVNRHKIIQIIEEHIVHVILICDRFVA